MDSSNSITYVILVTSTESVRHHIAGHGQANIEKLIQELEIITRHPLDKQIIPNGMIQLIQAAVTSLYLDHGRGVPEEHKEIMRRIMCRPSTRNLGERFFPWWL
jgi:hypothetical protein